MTTRASRALAPSASTPELELLKPSEAQSLLQCSKTFLYAEMARGALEYVRIGVGGDRRIRRSALRKYIESRTVDAGGAR